MVIVSVCVCMCGVGGYMCTHTCIVDWGCMYVGEWVGGSTSVR